jgi:superfamily I DNA and/or RNA helicase
VKGISFIGRAEKQVAWSKGPEWRSRGRERGTRYDNDSQTRELRSVAKDEILDAADIVCTTLSGASSQWLDQSKYRFETVIIDEAAQATELSSMIPLRYGCYRCIMIVGQ